MSLIVAHSLLSLLIVAHQAKPETVPEKQRSMLNIKNRDVKIKYTPAKPETVPETKKSAKNEKQRCRENTHRAKPEAIPEKKKLAKKKRSKNKVMTTTSS